MCCCVVALRRFLGYEAGICDKARDLDADDARYDELSRRARAAAADARARSAVDAGAATEGPSLTARVAAANRHARVELREVPVGPAPRGGARTANPLLAEAGAPPPQRDRSRDRARNRAELRSELDRLVASGAAPPSPRAPPPDLLSGVPPATPAPPPPPLPLLHPRVEQALRNEHALRHACFGAATTNALLGAEEPGAVDARFADAQASPLTSSARRPGDFSPGRPQPPLNVRETAGRVIDQSNIC